MSENLINKKFSTELLIITPVLTKGAGNYKDLDKTRVKLFANFTRHHLITHTYIIGDDLLLNFGAKFSTELLIITPVLTGVILSFT